MAGGWRREEQLGQVLKDRRREARARGSGGGSGIDFRTFDEWKRKYEEHRKEEGKRKYEENRKEGEKRKATETDRDRDQRAVAPSGEEEQGTAPPRAQLWMVNPAGWVPGLTQRQG